MKKAVPLTLAGIVSLLVSAINANADLTHRYSFNTDASDSVGSADGTLVDGALAGVPEVSGGQLVLNNADFSGPSSDANYLSLPVSILPTTGSITIEQWFTFSGSGFFTEAWAFSDRDGGANPPGSSSGQYFMHTISNPQPGGSPGADDNTGGSSIAQTLSGYGGGAETRAFETTPGLGAGGGGYLDNGETYMAATVLDGYAGTLSYYLYRASDGAGGLQSTIPAIALSSYSFTEAFIGRSAFDPDNATSGSVDEFRVYDNPLPGWAIAANFAAGPDGLITVPEPSTFALGGLALLGVTLLRRNRS